MAHKIYGQNVTIISGGGSSQPQLNAPTISITGNTLTITNPTSNGDFVTAYKVYTEYGYVVTVTETTVDLTTIITEDRTYNVFVTCVGTNFKDSIASNAVSWTLMTLATPQNVTADGTTVGWDEVENATSYEIYADNTLIGNVAAVTLISFTIAGTTYQAEEGMTWQQWVVSSYNTGGFYVTAGNTRVIFSNGADYVSSEGFAGDYANNTSQIVANGTYYKFSSGGGGN